MRIHLETADALTPAKEQTINTLASRGFGQAETPAMLQDTQEHLASADYIQQAFDNDRMVGFALYRRCLWRQSN